MSHCKTCGGQFDFESDYCGPGCAAVGAMEKEADRLYEALGENQEIDDGGSCCTVCNATLAHDQRFCSEECYDEYVRSWEDFVKE